MKQSNDFFFTEKNFMKLSAAAEAVNNLKVIFKPQVLVIKTRIISISFY